MTDTHPLLLGIEIGGTKLQLGVGRGDGHLTDLERLNVVPSNGGAGIRAQIETAAKTLLDRAGDGHTHFDAVGIGFGGPVDAKRGVVTVSNQIAGWADFPLVAWVRETLGVSRVSLQNDADTAALGEARFGAGRGASPVLYMTVGSGIGGGLIIDGKIYRGSGQGALEIGHTVIEENADSSLLSLEQIASGWSIGRDTAIELKTLVEQGLTSTNSPLLAMVDGDISRVTTALVARAAEEGDALALRMISRAAKAIAQALAHGVTLLAPQRIILGGGVSLMNPKLWIDPIRAGVDRRAFGPFRGTYEIVAPELGEEVVVHGAVALAADAVSVS